jgi:hypothetical protein
MNSRTPFDLAPGKFFRDDKEQQREEPRLAGALLSSVLILATWMKLLCHVCGFYFLFCFELNSWFSTVLGA